MEKLLKIQTEIGKLSKDKANPFFNSSYFDINQIIEQLLPLLEKYGITVLQPLSNVEGRPALATLIYDGDKLLSETLVTLPDLDNPQKLGSAVTYYRRYSLTALFLLQADDDDGNKASKKKAIKTNQSESDVPF